jgi:50S ribosomal protein L16 3-hydroxylase
LLIPAALPGFQNPLTGDELAGLAMEEEIESRLVIQTPDAAPYWHLTRGPFDETAFKTLPATHWTLLVQGVDRFVPEVSALLDYFNFLPQWRVDDVMISYAVSQGSVGPHYDNYDVFLYQAKGRRKWLLTSQGCVPENYQEGLELRIMKSFLCEQEIILEEGDMLYLPPHIAHHGISLSDECMTYSFGYRSYQAVELWNSLGDWLSEQTSCEKLYQDPLWTGTSGTAELPKEAVLQAKKIMQQLLEDETQLSTWFGSFVTTLDNQAESLLMQDVADDATDDFAAFQSHLAHGALLRNPLCRFSYQTRQGNTVTALFINGVQWDIAEVCSELLKTIANNRSISCEQLAPYVTRVKNQEFLYHLWQLEWLWFADEE